MRKYSKGPGGLGAFRRPHVVTLFLPLLALGACKGGVVTGSNPPGVTPGGSGALGSYYVQSFAPFETAAAALRGSSRYLLQTSSWFFRDPVTNQQSSPTYNSFPLASARIEYAHAVGLTGQGQTVAIADTRLNSGHEVFTGKTVVIDSNAPANGTGNDDHGTMVASILAGQSASFIGTAPGANLLFGTFNSDATLASITNLATAQHAVAQNNSWGFDTLPVNVASYNLVFQGTSALNYLNALDTYAAQGVVVFALSNDQTHTQATLMDALPALRPSLESGWIAVGNAVPTYDSQTITSVQLLSSGCYEAAQWCMLADGAWTAATAAGNSTYKFGTGSSFAAPQVSGALALLAEAFPRLSPHDLRLRLLASANNSFFTPDGSVALTPTFSHDYSNIYGHGFLDLRAALLPIGATTMSLANGTVQRTDAPMIVSGAALGDAVARSLTGVNVAVSDSLNGDFRMPGRALLATVTPAPLSDSLLSQALGDDLASLRLGSAGSASQPFAAFQGVKLAALDPTGGFSASVLMPYRGSTDESFGIDMKQVLIDGTTRLDLGLKLARDGGSVMGFGSAGGTGTELASLEVGVTQDIGGGGFLALMGEVGLANLGGQAALSDVSKAVFNSVSLDIGQHDMWTTGDKLSVGLNMPVAVTAGSARLNVPTFDAAGGRNFEQVGLDLSPSDRQIDLALTYQRPLSDNSEMMLQLVHADNFGNRSGVEDMAGLLAMKFRF